MLLAIDVGNTQTVIGTYVGSALSNTWRIATNKAHTADEIRLKIASLLEQANIEAAEIDGVALASVVPALSEAWKAAIDRAFQVEPVLCSARTAGDLFKTSYPNPAEIGSDRIADSVAAVALYGAPVVVVDFGTATNIEVVDAQGNFMGGIIAPGFNASADALVSRATKLPAVDLVEPVHAIGRSTVEAMQSGIVYGEADRIDGLVRRVFDQLGYTAPVVATGGLATTIAPLAKTVTEINPDLTLEGLRLIFEAQTSVE